MYSLVLLLRAFLVEDDGPTATEYAVMLALVIMVAVGGIAQLGQFLVTQYNAAAAVIPAGP